MSVFTRLYIGSYTMAAQLSGDMSPYPIVHAHAGDQHPAAFHEYPEPSEPPFLYRGERGMFFMASDLFPADFEREFVRDTSAIFIHDRSSVRASGPSYDLRRLLRRDVDARENPLDTAGSGTVRAGDHAMAPRPSLTR